MEAKAKKVKHPGKASQTQPGFRSSVSLCIRAKGWYLINMIGSDGGLKPVTRQTEPRGGAAASKSGSQNRKVPEKFTFENFFPKKKLQRAGN